jgi:hypothetical protein
LESDYDVGYGYDTFGRFAQVSNFQFQVSYSYLSGSSLVSGMTASTGHAWTRSYEPQRNLITSVTNSFNGNLISAFEYVNDEIGRVPRDWILNLPGLRSPTSSGTMCAQR